jgi:hypothetical protein
VTAAAGVGAWRFPGSVSADHEQRGFDGFAVAAARPDASSDSAARLSVERHRVTCAASIEAIRKVEN